MDRERIKHIVRLLKTSSAAELSVREGDSLVRVTRGGVIERSQVAQTLSTPQPQASAAPVATMGEVSKITSRLVGFFYRGKGPDAPPIIEAGAKVKEGQTVGYIEALRKLTEVVTPVSGEVVEVVAESGQAVQFGDVLILVRPEETSKSGKGPK